MGTTIEKLTKVLQTKEAIRTAINNKGGTLAESDTFSSYSIAIDNIQTGSEENPFQEVVDNRGGDGVSSCQYLFYQYRGTSLDNILKSLDFSKVTSMIYMFSNCSNLTSIPQLDTSSVANMSYMFVNCSKLTSIPQLDTSGVTNMDHMFGNCSNLTTIPQLDTSKVTDMGGMFANCSNLTSVKSLDMNKVTSTYDMFNGCKALTNLKLLNVKTNLQIGSGSSYGHLIEKDCLIQIIGELIEPNYGTGTRTLTMGTTNKAKLADTYVKILDSSGTRKYPFEICESTDEGAMTIEAYCNSKNWTLA